MALSAINFMGWIDDNRDKLKPPVGNCEVYPNHEFIVMVIGGPNTRTDYHVNAGEEFFYQLEGDIVLKVVEDGEFRDIPIKEGEILLLPAGIPHSPRRPANTVGLVIERERREGEIDQLLWFCEECNTPLHREAFNLQDIAKDLIPAIKNYYASTEKHRCVNCGAVDQVPT
ncbi:MAG TPA: 3-hydroxyanthranilate 3,4-dioxygenase [Myxococcales bacterium]|nr:3-hydroxyanthranilate 3,4-dioxygenase [Myxococcales bacterium]HBU46960.1 3-hydroxyanthranilate 3,4-dioxygenase [Myxococcales bacterium]